MIVHCTASAPAIIAYPTQVGQVPMCAEVTTDLGVMWVPITIVVPLTLLVAVALVVDVRQQNKEWAEQTEQDRSEEQPDDD